MTDVNSNTETSVRLGGNGVSDSTQIEGEAEASQVQDMVGPRDSSVSPLDEEVFAPGDDMMGFDMRDEFVPYPSGEDEPSVRSTVGSGDGVTLGRSGGRSKENIKYKHKKIERQIKARDLIFKLKLEDLSNFNF